MTPTNTMSLFQGSSISQETNFKLFLTTTEINWEESGTFNNESESENNETSLTSENFSDEVHVLPIDMQFNDGHRLAISVYSVLMVFSAIGNFSVLVTIFRWRKRQGRLTPMNLLLSHLAIADLIVTLLMMPMEIAWNATVSWKAGDLLCRILSFTRIFGLYLSGFTLMCISLDRYYAVVHPLSITQSRQRCRFMLLTAWIFSVICSSPQVLIFHVESHPVFTWYQQCITFNSFPSPDYELAYNFLGFAFMYGIPLTTIIACYTRILWKIWRMNSQRREETQLRRSTMGAIGRAKSRTLKMTVVIVSTFFFCWTPYNIMCIWYWLDSQSASQVDQRIQKALFLFACTNSCMNPLIYGLFHFRKRHLPGGGTGAANMGTNLGEAGSVVGLHSTSSPNSRSMVISMVTNNGCGRNRSMAVSTF